MDRHVGVSSRVWFETRVRWHGAGGHPDAVTAERRPTGQRAAAANRGDNLAVGSCVGVPADAHPPQAPAIDQAPQLMAGDPRST
jgi:hypothetical protein